MVSPLKLTNNAVSRLDAAITAADTSITLQAGGGAVFPSLTSGQYFPVTLVNENGTMEIVRCTARVSDVLTITRAQEGTVAASFVAGARVESRMTAATFTGEIARVEAAGADLSVALAAAAAADAKAVAIRNDLAATGGAAIVGYIGSGTGATPTTVQAVLRESVSVSRFGMLPSNPDNSAAMAAVVAFLHTFDGTGLSPKMVIPSGTYNYTTGPNWAVQGLCLEASGGVLFKHNGSGVAFTLDGGASGGGKYEAKIQGQLQIHGNAATTIGCYVRAIHHGYISVRPRDCGTVLKADWCVCTTFDVQATPVGYPMFNPIPTIGILLGERNLNEKTSACTFINPIMEGINGYGINLQGAVMNNFIGGTSESNAGGVFISATSSYNTFTNLDMEFNIAADIFCQGYYNNFIGCMSSTTSTFGGSNNLIQSGIYNAISQQGIHNEYLKVRYASNGGGFSETAQSIKTSVRNSQSNTMDPDWSANPRVMQYYDATPNYQMVMGRDDYVSGGPGTDFCFYKFGSGGKVKFLVQGAMKLSMDGYGLGFNGVNPISKPYITGSCNTAGNPAIANIVIQIVSALTAYGLIDNAITN